MLARPIPVIATLVVALALVAGFGLRLLDRDRDALVARFAHERELGMLEAAHGFEDDLADMGEDLELASALTRAAETPQLAERELHAIATIKREYLVVYARLRDQPPTRLTAFDAPPGADALAAATLEAMLGLAQRQPGVLHVSEAFAPRGRPGAWYRVFARRPVDRGPAVAVAVDLAVMLGRLKLVHDPAARVLVLDGRDDAAALSDRALATVRTNATLRAVIAETHGGHPAMRILEPGLATQIGLPNTRAIAIAVPIVVDGGPAWTLLVVTSTQALETQERTVVRRVLVGGVVVLGLLLSAAAYVMRSSYRARALRERLRAADRLALSEKLVTAGQLAAGIAHEVGTPLNVARGRAELTLSHLGPAHPDAGNQQIVIDQIDRVTRLLQQLLDYVRPAPSVIVPIVLAQTLRVVVELLAPQATKRGVSVQIDAASELTPLHADPDQMQQILVNLVLNAIDACERNGHVVLRATATGAAGVRLAITDDGCGIPREHQQQVFDPFFTTKKRGQGTGLGLWVVAQLVRAQGAEIELDSTPGRGTTVAVTWPSQQGAAT